MVLSGYGVGLVAKNADKVVLLEIYKGIFFVLATTILLYYLTYKFFRIMRSQYDANLKRIAKHQETKENLKVSQNELSKYDMLLNTIVNSSPDAPYMQKI